MLDRARGVKPRRRPKLTPHQRREAIERGEALPQIDRSYNVSADYFEAL